MAKITKQCLWEKVTSELIAYIKDNKLEAGVGFFSVDEVSKRYGVSNITSRRALTELANKNLIERSRGRGNLVKKQNSIKTVYIMSYTENGQMYILQSFILSELFKGILEECRRNNIKTELIMPKFLNSLPTDSRINLILLQNFPAHLTEIADRLINDENINCVCCHSLHPHEKINTVRVDFKQGAYDAVSHLLEKGHRNIAFIESGGKVWMASRFDGYYQALKDNNIYFDSKYVQSIETNRKQHYAAMDKLMALDTPPSAIFCGCDENAIYVLDYCREKGLKVPQDIAVTGYDNSPHCSLVKPSLTSVDIHLAEEGRECIRLLLKDLPKDKIEDSIIKPKLIIRSST